jgi:hypothetical protein
MGKMKYETLASLDFNSEYLHNLKIKKLTLFSLIFFDFEFTFLMSVMM